MISALLLTGYAAFKNATNPPLQRLAEALTYELSDPAPPSCPNLTTRLHKRPRSAFVANQALMANTALDGAGVLRHVRRDDMARG